MLYPKPLRRPKKRPDRTPASEAEYVLARDRECVIAKLGLDHQCEGRLTIEHLLRRAGRRVHGRRWMVAVCLHGNVDGDASKYRGKLREYVAAKEPE